MRTTTTLQRNFNFSILSIAVSLGLYVIEIFDWALTYEIFIDIPLILTICSSLVFFVLAIIEAKKSNQLPSIPSILIFAFLLAVSVSIYGNRNGIFWGEKIIDAAFLDDRSRMDLELYENGKYLIYSNWLFGENRFEGNYKLNGDTIVFTKTPVTDNDFIEQKIIIDRSARKIYFRKDNEGNYDKSFYYFQIDF
jgi:hypothetical protein